MTRRLLLLLCCACGCEVQGDLLRTVPEPDMAAPPECTASQIGGPAICGAAADLQARAVSVCTSSGRALTTFSPYEPCGAGQYRYARYECCPTTERGACAPETQGGETSCKGERDWYGIAVASCGVGGKAPVGLSFFRPCAEGGVDMGGLYRYARYLCCP